MECREDPGMGIPGRFIGSIVGFVSKVIGYLQAESNFDQWGSWSSKALHSLQLWRDPDMDLIMVPSVLTDYAVFGNTPHQESIFVGPGLFGAVVTQVPGAVGSTIVVRDSSDGSDGVVIHQATNPVYGTVINYGGLKLKHGLHVTTTNGGAGAAPVVTVVYAKKPVG